jgi:hypothetical protein
VHFHLHYNWVWPRDITGTNHENPKVNKGKETILENFHTLGSLGNSLSWGDQPIPETMDKVVDVQDISYDSKRQLIVNITGKKRRITLESVVMITIKETLLDVGQSKVSELLGESMSISRATIDREREDERESNSM